MDTCHGGGNARRECRDAEPWLQDQLFKNLVSDRMSIPLLKGVRTPGRPERVSTIAGEARAHEFVVPEPHEGTQDDGRATMVICTEPQSVFRLSALGPKVVDGRGEILPGDRKGINNGLLFIKRAGMIESGWVLGNLGRTGGSEITGVFGGEEIWWLDGVTSIVGSS